MTEKIFLTSKIKNLPITIVDGDRSSRYPKRDELQKEGIPFLNSTNIHDFCLDLTDINFVSEEKFKTIKKGILKKQDIIMTTRGSVGKVALFNAQYESGIINAQMVIIRADGQQINQNYLFYVLCSQDFQSQIRNYSSGSAQPQLPIRDFNEMELQYPPLPTQHKIASILSAYDDLIENNTRRIKILEEMAQSIYREWFVNYRFPGHEKVKMVDSPLGLIPEGWEVKYLGEIADNFDRMRKPLSSMERAKLSGPYPYYGAAKVFDYIKDYIFDGSYLLMAEDGSVITKEGKPVLQRVKGKFWANNHTHILRARSPMSNDYMYLSLVNLDIAGYVTGAAQPKITQSNLNRIPIIKPDEKTLISFQSIISEDFSLIDTLNDVNTNLRQTRDLLLPRLISGEVDVSDLDIEIPEDVSQ